MSAAATEAYTELMGDVCFAGSAGDPLYLHVQSFHRVKLAEHLEVGGKAETFKCRIIKRLLDKIVMPANWLMHRLDPDGACTLPYMQKVFRKRMLSGKCDLEHDTKPWPYRPPKYAKLEPGARKWRGRPTEKRVESSDVSDPLKMVQTYFSAIKFKKYKKIKIRKDAFSFLSLLISLILILKYEKTSFHMFNYRLFCGVRLRKFVVAGPIGTTKKHLLVERLKNATADDDAQPFVDRAPPRVNRVCLSCTKKISDQHFCCGRRSSAYVPWTGRMRSLRPQSPPSPRRRLDRSVEVASLHLVRPLPAENVCVLRHSRHVLRRPQKSRTKTFYLPKSQ